MRIREEKEGYWIITAHRGDSMEFDVYVTDPGTGLPTSLVGAEVRFAVRREYNAATKIVDEDTSGSITITDEDNGIIHVVGLLPSDLSNEFQHLPFDVEIEQGGRKWTVAAGHVELVPEVAYV